MSGRSILVKKGEWNKVELWFGPPGSGKSVNMMRTLRRYLGRAFIIAHDPNGNLPTKLAPDGLRVAVRMHEADAPGDGVDSIRAALIKGGPPVVHATNDEPSRLIGLARDVARAAMRTLGGEEFGVPVILVADELSVWEEASQHRIGPALRDLLSRRRHMHVAFFGGAQFPRMIHYSLISQANALHFARMEERKDLERLCDGGVPEAIIARVPSLARYQFLDYSR